MKRAWFFGTLAVLLLGVAWAQFTPPPMGLYIKPGTTWTPATTASSAGQVSYSPPPAGAYCKNASSGQWAPCTTLGGTDATGSGGAAGQIPIANGDGTFTWAPYITSAYLTGVSASIGQTVLIPGASVTTAGSAYLVCGTLTVTVAGGTGATLQAAIAFTQGGTLKGPSVGGAAFVATIVGATNNSGGNAACQIVSPDVGTPINYFATVAGSPPTNPTYTYLFTAQRLR